MLLGIGKKEIHFLMGAGASYASADTKPFRVPLGKDLFDSLLATSNSWFLNSIPEPVKNVFREDFEKGMEIFFNENQDPTWLQNELAKYFLKFTAGTESVYLKLIDLLERHRAIYSFSTTNYEMLIEQCLHLKNKFPYYGIDVRLDPLNLISVLKIHGSSNFIADADLSTTVMSGNKFPSRISIASYPTKAAMPEEAFQFASANNGFAPSLAMYAKGKNVLHAPEVVTLQHELWKLKLKHQCKMLVIVGLRIIEHDNHIWDFLASNKNLPILYIGDQGEFERWRNLNDRKNCEFVGGRFEESLQDLEKYIEGKMPIG